MSKDNGQLAFPVVCDDVSRNQVFETGMTLRDYFAAKAMQGCLASCPAGIAWHNKDGLPLKEWASTSYKMADAMIAERSK